MRTWLVEKKKKIVGIRQENLINYEYEINRPQTKNGKWWFKREIKKRKNRSYI